MDPVEQALRESGAEWWRTAPGEWGAVVPDVGGRPLEVGLRRASGLLRAQAEAAWPGAADPLLLLHRNRLGELVRYAHSSGGVVWVQGELPLDGLTAAGVERLLVRLVQAALAVRPG